MKNNLFGKQLTTLIMGSLMIFPAQALAMKANNLDIPSTEALGESEIFIAQNGELPSEDFEVQPQPLPRLLLEAGTILRNLQAKLNSVSESDLPGKNAVSQIVVNLESVIGDLGLSLDNQALTKGQGVALAEQAFNLVTTVGDICAELGTRATSEEGRAVAECCVQGSTSLDDIALEIKSIAEEGF